MNLSSKYTLGTILLLTALLSGCIVEKNFWDFTKTQPKQKKSIPAPTKAETKKIKNIKQTYYVHVVRYEGETLSLISNWYIGNYKDWKLLAQHNPELNPNSIHVGDRVWIPKGKMRTSKQLPATFVNKKNKGPEKVKKHGRKKEKPIELYGPKEHKEKDEEFNHD